MKKLILLFFVIIFSCSTKIDKKDIQGTWYWNHKENDNNNLGEIVIKNDSITLFDYLDFVKKGTFKIKKDSIIIILKDEVISKKVAVTYSSIILNSTYFKKSYEEDIEHKENNKEYELINIKSDIQLTAENLSHYQGEFLLHKENDSIKFRFWNKNTSIWEYIYSIPVHFEKIGHIALLGKNLTLKEIKRVFLEMNYYNIRDLKFVTKIDFKKNKYDVFFVRIDAWDKEVNEYLTENKFEKHNNHNFPENYSKERYIIENSPLLLKIKSKNDFTKLDNAKNNTTYLISININLPIDDYLFLHQKINKVRKNKNLKIRTEIIEFLPN